MITSGDVMAVGIQITFETDKDGAQAVIDELRDRLENAGLAQFLEKVVEPFIKLRIENRFHSEGDDVTGGWQPLHVATQLIRASYGFPPDHPINVRTSQMKDFLVNSRSDIKNNGADVTLIHPPPTGNKGLDEKIKTAQQGKTKPRTPPRPVLGFNENDLLFVTSELAAYLVEGIV